jgi:diadenosine tetraphosphate (Ap4A) HIT family hydrolase
VFAIVDNKPINQYHLLVIPREHYRTLADLPDNVASRLILMMKRLSFAVRQTAQPDAVTHISDDDITGRAFNQVEHFKFHIIPRHMGDAVQIAWNRGGEAPIEARARSAAAIRAALT